MTLELVTNITQKGKEEHHDLEGMNPRLFDAAQMGNLQALYELLAEDPLVLEKVTLGSSISETPLHIAALLGHLDFAKEIIRRKPVFAKELNKDGFGPLHMASANGHIEIVKELLMMTSPAGCSSNLCHLKDREGRTPLHYAVINGRTDVMSELLFASSDSVREVTTRSETILHLAVRNNQFEALKMLVDERHIDAQILNTKDMAGNTVLHLAIARKHHSTIKLLLSNQTVLQLEVNAKNAKNCTALDILDVLNQNSYESRDVEISEMLLRAGAMRTEEMINNQAPLLLLAPLALLGTHVSANGVPRHEPPATHPRNIWKEVSKEICREIYRELDNSASETRSSLMVVAVLIATMTFQAGINPPGDVWQDNNPHGNSKNTTRPNAAMAADILCYVAFLTYNTTGFLMSLAIIYLLTSRFPLKSWLRVAVISMLGTYVCCVCYLTFLPQGPIVCILMSVLLFGAIIGWIFWWLKKLAQIIQTERRMT